jgi:hypothetical protein
MIRISRALTILIFDLGNLIGVAMVDLWDGQKKLWDNETRCKVLREMREEILLIIFFEQCSSGFKNYDLMLCITARSYRSRYPQNVPYYDTYQVSHQIGSINPKNPKYAPVCQSGQF